MAPSAGRQGTSTGPNPSPDHAPQQEVADALMAQLGHLAPKERLHSEVSSKHLIVFDQGCMLPLIGGKEWWALPLLGGCGQSAPKQHLKLD